MAGFTKQTLLIRTHHGTTRQRSQSNQIPIVAVFSDSGLQLPHIIDRGWTWQLERLMMNSLGTFESLRHGRWYSLALERIRPSRLQETASAGWRNMTFNNPGDFFQRETTTLYTPCTTSCGFLLNQIDFPPSIDHKLQYVSACALVQRQWVLLKVAGMIVFAMRAEVHRLWVPVCAVPQEVIIPRCAV